MSSETEDAVLWLEKTAANGFVVTLVATEGSFRVVVSERGQNGRILATGKSKNGIAEAATRAEARFRLHGQAPT
jgi:hypothetical protein